MSLTNISLQTVKQSRDEELRKIDKLKFVFNMIKQFTQNSIFETNTKNESQKLDNLTQAIKIISVQDYIKLKNGMNILGLALDTDTIKITYNERKIILEYLINNISLKLDPVFKFMDSIKPELFDNQLKCSEIIVLEEKRQMLYFELLELKYKKCKLLQYCTEIKIGPNLMNKLKILSLKYNINQTKVELLNKYIVHEFNSSRHKALEEINTYLDEALEKK